MLLGRDGVERPRGAQCAHRVWRPRSPGKRV